jgi:hypothetical protein
MAWVATAPELSDTGGHDALEEALRQALDPQFVVSDLITVVKTLAEQANALADLAEHIVIGLKPRLPERRLSRQLAGDIERSRESGVSDEEMVELLKSLGLSGSDSRKLELSLAEIGLTLELKQRVVVKDPERVRRREQIVEYDQQEIRRRHGDMRP